MGKTLDAKIRNDLQSLVRSLAEATGRNAAWYQRSVSEAASLTAAEAVRERVVDFLAISPEDYAQQLGKRGLATADGLMRFQGSQVRFEPFDAGLRHTLLSWLLDPQIAYILLLVGVAGLFFELTTPGAVLPGVVGGLCLLPALYALSILPTNATGLLLLFFGAGLFLLEIHITSYGLLSLAGLAALFTGSLLLFDGQGAEPLSLGLVSPTVIGVSLILAGAGWLLAKAQRQKPRTGREALPGQAAQVRHWEGSQGKVFVRGELWDAVLDADAAGNRPVVAGDTVRIVSIQDMVLVVAPFPQP
ncbi:MAG: NfeD family protein [Solidesulfovibrio sp. DCME]|uniref:NfeD family protein n=1 Tax=Solidesulfovibrio sp. DCME TaxID=3447380 RepID=UPI003D101CA9